MAQIRFDFSGNVMRDQPDNIREYKIEYGTDLSYLVSRLKQERPDLFEQVKAKKLSAHAAALQAGFRKQPVQLPPGITPEHLARVLVSKFGEEWLSELAERITTGAGDLKERLFVDSILERFKDKPYLRVSKSMTAERLARLLMKKWGREWCGNFSAALCDGGE